MTSLLLDQKTDGATTAIAVGRFGDDFTSGKTYRSVLWIVDTEGARRQPRGLATANPMLALLEETGVGALKSMLEQFVLRDGRALPDILVTADVAERFTKGYEMVIDGIHDVLESARRVRLTRREEGFLWQKHFFLNLPRFVRRRVPDAWEHALAGLPAIVCGAGPSLDVSAAVAARFAGDAVVFAADSALRTLARHGVAADFAISVDAAKQPDKCLPAACAPARLVLAGISPPAWQDCEADFRLLYLSGNHLTERLLESRGVPPTPVRVAENCGITAFELARFLGCAPICLFGMDLASDVDDPARRHAADTDPTIDRGSGFQSQRQMPQVAGNYRETVPTFLFGELRHFNQCLASLAPGLVVNVNDRGARLANATLTHPAAFSLPRVDGFKRRRLWRLPAPARCDAETARLALAEIGALGAWGSGEIPSLRALLRERNGEAFLAAMRRLFSHDGFARAMGSFALKAMPHLTADAPGTFEIDEQLTTELEELCCLAESLSDARQG